MRIKTISLFIHLLMGTFALGQVGIGTSSPNVSAIFELDVSSLASGNKKGFLGPRLALTSRTDIATIPNPATGLLVYNLGTGGLSYVGYVYWNGTEWRSFNNTTTSSAAITSLQCFNATLSPALLTAGVPYSGYMYVPYTGGNGAAYSGGNPISSSGNTGLTATLQPGQLNQGDGTLTYLITGTPLQSSPNLASFALPSTLGASGCTASVGTSAASGNQIRKLIYTGTQPDNNQTMTIGGMVFRITNGTSWNIQMALSSSLAKTVYVGMNQQYSGNGFEYANWTKTFTAANATTFQNIATDTSNIIVNTELNIFHIVDVDANAYYRVTAYISGPNTGTKAFVIIAEQF